MHYGLGLLGWLFNFPHLPALSKIEHTPMDLDCYPRCRRRVELLVYGIQRLPGLSRYGDSRLDTIGRIPPLAAAVTQPYQFPYQFERPSG